MSDLLGILDRIRRAGGTIWVDGSRVRYRAPVGTVSDSDRQTLAAHRDVLAGLLPAAPPCERTDYANKVPFEVDDSDLLEIVAWCRHLLRDPVEGFAVEPSGRRWAVPQTMRDLLNLYALAEHDERAAIQFVEVGMEFHRATLDPSTRFSRT